MKPQDFIAPRFMPRSRRRRREQRDAIGSSQDIRLLILFVLLPVFCLIDFAADTGQQTQAHRYLQKVSDLAAIEGAQIFALGGDRIAVETEIYEVFQTLVEGGPKNANCAIESISLSQSKRMVSIESHCSKPPNIGSILLGRPKTRVEISVRAVFRELERGRHHHGLLPEVWLVE